MHDMRGSKSRVAASFLSRASTIAPPGYDRFQVPPTALAVHLSIGQAYALSIFYLPLTRIIGITHSAPGDWRLADVGGILTVAIAVLGLSAATFARWVEQAGPRLSMLVAAVCFGSGFIVAAIGVHYHLLWLLYLGYGVIGGCGLGIGYISPVSVLIQWFSDRPGMASGMALAGFPGGALIAAPLSVLLMNHFRTAISNGVLESFVTMGVMYFMFMMIGVYAVRVPADDLKPAGTSPGSAPSQSQVAIDAAWRTPQFWLLWGVLGTLATSGIGVLEQVSRLIAQILDGRVTPSADAGFAGLISLCSMLGGFLWASASDIIGRRKSFTILFALAILLNWALPWSARLHSTAPFVAAFSVLFSLYGGGFTTIVAYVRDVFGSMHVGAIHGRLLTAWSVAAILGPALFGFIRDYAIDAGVAKAQAYTVAFPGLSLLLLIGLVCNLCMRPVSEKYHHRETAPSSRGQHS